MAKKTNEEKLRSAEMSMRGMLSPSFGQGNGGEFVEPVVVESVNVPTRSSILEEAYANAAIDVGVGLPDVFTSEGSGEPQGSAKEKSSAQKAIDEWDALMEEIGESDPEEPREAASGGEQLPVAPSAPAATPERAEPVAPQESYYDSTEAMLERMRQEGDLRRAGDASRAMGDIQQGYPPNIYLETAKEALDEARGDREQFPNVVGDRHVDTLQYHYDRAMREDREFRKKPLEEQQQIREEKEKARQELESRSRVDFVSFESPKSVDDFVKQSLGSELPLSKPIDVVPQISASAELPEPVSDVAAVSQPELRTESPASPPAIGRLPEPQTSSVTAEVETPTVESPSIEMEGVDVDVSQAEPVVETPPIQPVEIDPAKLQDSRPGSQRIGGPPFLRHIAPPERPIVEPGELPQEDVSKWVSSAERAWPEMDFQFEPGGKPVERQLSANERRQSEFYMEFSDAIDDVGLAVGETFQTVIEHLQQLTRRLNRLEQSLESEGEDLE
jgi:hypothetical protein